MTELISETGQNVEKTVPMVKNPFFTASTQEISNNPFLKPPEVKPSIFSANSSKSLV